MVGAALHVDAEVCEEDSALGVTGFLGHALDVGCLDLLLGLVDEVFHGLCVSETVHEFLFEDDQGDVHRLHCDVCQHLEVVKGFLVHGSFACAHLLFILDDILGVVGNTLEVVYDLNISVELVQVFGRKVEGAELHKLSEDCSGQIVDGLFALKSHLAFLGIVFKEAVDRILQVVDGEVSHSADLAVRLIHSDDRGDL